MDILRICRQLKPKLSLGADFISTKLLKEIAPIIITPLHYLINLSLETGFVPKEFKIAKVVCNVISLPKVLYYHGTLVLMTRICNANLTAKIK